MVREIVKDRILLAQKALSATAEDIPVADDLLDTLKAHREECVGMAANMIGVNKRIIVFADGDKLTVFLNPVILEKSEPYEVEEGCLSLSGTRKTERFGKITVSYQNKRMEQKRRTFTGFPAEIIQHEIDHCEGILI